MVALRIYTAEEISVNAVDRWRKSYADWEPQRKFADGKTKKQNDDAFDQIEHTPDAIAAIMGNKSWTHPQCTFCGNYCDKVISVKDEWDDKSTEICKTCVSKISTLAKML